MLNQENNITTSPENSDLQNGIKDVENIAPIVEFSLEGDPRIPDTDLEKQWRNGDLTFEEFVQEKRNRGKELQSSGEKLTKSLQGVWDGFSGYAKLFTVSMSAFTVTALGGVAYQTFGTKQVSTETRQEPIQSNPTVSLESPETETIAMNINRKIEKKPKTEAEIIAEIDAMPITGRFLPPPSRLGIKGNVVDYGTMKIIIENFTNLRKSTFTGDVIDVDINLLWKRFLEAGDLGIVEVKKVKDKKLYPVVREQLDLARREYNSTLNISFDIKGGNMSPEALRAIQRRVYALNRLQQIVDHINNNPYSR